MNGARWLCLLLSTATASSAGGGAARLFFSRTFPGSAPAYFEVRVEKTGDAEYREAPDEELPLKFKLSEEEAAAVFALAEKLDYFRHPLESPAKVAFMGTKLLRYESGDGQSEVKSEVKFNYSEDCGGARRCSTGSSRMAESAELRIDLERAAKYDHLGVMHALETLDAAMEGHRVVGAGQFLPMLDRITNTRNLHARGKDAGGGSGGSDFAIPRSRGAHLRFPISHAPARQRNRVFSRKERDHGKSRLVAMPCRGEHPRQA